METYLLAWNPKRFPWEDLQDCIKIIHEQGYYSCSWSVGVTRKIQPGDRAFLIRLGLEPRGLIASGWISSEVYEGKSWDGSAKNSLYVDVNFDIVLDPNSESIFPRQKLNEGILAEMHWDIQGSGKTIPNHIAEKLEIEWDIFLSRSAIEDYKIAFQALENQMTESDFAMLQAHYRAPNHTLTATQMARAVGFNGFEAANLRYGQLAGRIADFLDLRSSEYINLYVLATFERPEQEWLWIMRPQVVQALHELGWFDKETNVLQEIQLYEESYRTLDETTRKAVIDSRIGQGLFREALRRLWGGCAVTGCNVAEVLKASHIKPWRNSTNEERLNPYNGLLLVPNLDSAFDRGLISFDDSGHILISSVLSEESCLQLGINSSMNLRQSGEQSKVYLKFHRENIFRS